MQDDRKLIVTRGLSYTQALKRSVDEGKILVLVDRWVEPPQGRRPWWTNPTLRRWAASEAIVIELEGSGISPRVLARIRSTGWCMLTGTILALDGKVLSMRAAMNFGAGAGGVNPGGRVAATASLMLHHMDLQMEMLAARDPVFAIRVEQRRAQDARVPADDPLSAIGSPGIPGVGDPSASGANPLQRLDEARALIKTDPARAIALLTWLWDRGPSVEPALALLREPVLLPLFLEVGKVSQLARQRLCELAEAYPADPDGSPEATIAARVLDVHTIEHDGRAAGIVEGIAAALDADEQLLNGQAVARQRDVLVGIGLGEPLRPADDAFIRDVRRLLEFTGENRKGDRATADFYIAVISHETVRSFVAGLCHHRVGEARAIEWATQQVQASGAWPTADQARLRRALALAALAQPKMSSELTAAARAWLADSGSPVPAWMNSRVAGAARGPGLP